LINYKIRFFTLTLLVLAISFIILDNHFIYETMIKSKIYFRLREKVRLVKTKSGLKYQTEKNSEANSDNNQDLSLFHRMGKMTANGYLDEAEIVSLKGSYRLNDAKNFLNIYRNSSKQSNIIILGDLIYEFLGSQIDTLFVPFKTPDYCYEFAETLWCQIESLSWFVYPIMVVIFDDYSYELNESEYYSIKRNLLRVEGSDNTLINIPIANRNGNRQNYYLYSYGKEIFVYPLSDALSG